MSTKSEKLPWYKRWFSRSSPQAGAQGGAKKGATSPTVIPVSYSCEECGFAAKIRGVVYDHIKSVHKTILDRNGRIREQPQSQSSPLN